MQVVQFLKTCRLGMIKIFVHSEIRFIQDQIIVVAVGSGNYWFVALCVTDCGAYLGAKWIGSLCLCYMLI